MSRCEICYGRGVVKIQYREQPERLDLAACRCKAGEVFRLRWQLRLFAARAGLRVDSFGFLEEFEDASDPLVKLA